MTLSEWTPATHMLVHNPAQPCTGTAQYYSCTYTHARLNTTVAVQVLTLAVHTYSQLLTDIDASPSHELMCIDADDIMLMHITNIDAHPSTQVVHKYELSCVGSAQYYSCTYTHARLNTTVAVQDLPIPVHQLLRVAHQHLCIFIT